ncbi:MAG: sodium-dependent transporter [Bacteroidaceae bacterium]|nr:sodium-dependent transporter [Bacteroidaceae bacterium]
MVDKRVNFGSKIGVIFATVGSAVGLGNVWRFPYVTGENGGAAFLVVYALCVALLGIPCMVSEFIIGRSAQANTARAFTKMADGRPWKWIGYLSVFTGFAITCYYAIVSGWCFHYIFAPFISDLSKPELVEQHFAQFSGNPIEPVAWTLGLILICHFIITRGVQKGIEKMSKIFMPMLFILLLIIVVSSCLLPGAMEGLKFLFLPDFSKLTANSVLAAMGQSFYSLSIAMGCVCTYASYFSHETNLTRTAVQISVLDSMVAIIAGMMIFPAAFAVGIRPDAGASLVFVTLPNVFNQAFSAMPFVGNCVSVAFYTLLSIAALTSLISLHEVATAFVQEEANLTRKKAAAVVTCVAIIIGAFCSLSLGDWSWLQVAGMSLFDFFDYTTGQILLPVIGFLTCIFLGWFGPRDRIRAEFTNNGTYKGKLFKCYLFLIKFFCPVAIALVFLNQIGII